MPSFEYEKNIAGIADSVSGLSSINSGIADILSGTIGAFYDTTATLLWSMVATASGLDTGAAAVGLKTKTATADLTNYKENTLYLDTSSLVALNAMTTGFQYTIFSRPTATMSWATILTNSAVGKATTQAIKMVGSGGSNSGISHLGLVKIELVNASNSGTALSTGYILSRTP